MIVAPVSRFSGHLYTTLVVLVGWVLFRAADLESAINLLAVMFGIKQGGNGGPLWLDLANGQAETAFMVGFIACTDAGQRVALRLDNGLLNIAALASFCASTIVLASSAFNPFIYFRF